MVKLALPWPPSVNAYWRSVVVRGAARVLLSREGRDYRDRVLTTLANWHGEPMQGRLSVSIRLYPPTRHAIDIDNRVKAVLDALMHARVIGDDEQVDELRVTRCDRLVGGAVEVEIEEISLASGSTEADR